jgi:DNA helicase II / ATP-dependent DNA helicase PcrA
MPTFDADALLADLEPAQREAVATVRGPLCILAGAGTGKTRVISRRVAYALATDAVRPSDVLVVTFTDKAASEMRERLAAAGRQGVSAFTFHAAALRQLRHFWPRIHGGDLPGILSSKVQLLAPLAATLPGGYRYAVRDLAAEIEWAKARRITPATYLARVAAEAHDGPLPADLMGGLFRRYETARDRAGLIDFEDMLARTVELLETDRLAADEVRDRYRWFSVDEYQDTNPLQQAVLDAWLGGRDDLAVVGDEDQTIYTFTGATSDYLTGFQARYPAARVVRLESNFRSTPQVLALANRVLAAGRAAADERAPGVVPRPAKRLVATLDGGPEPHIAGFDTDEAELRAMTAAMRTLARDGTPHGEMAVLVRTNAQLPALEAGLGAAGIPFHVRGERFFARPEVRRALRVAATLDRPSAVRRVAESPAALPARLAEAFERELGVRRADAPDGDAARERHAAVVTLLELAEDLAAVDPAVDVTGFLAEVERRADAESAGAINGVELLTYHRAKGLEWEAAFLPALEDGTLPIRQATEPRELAEERRLLYVGITRARRHLWLSWARRRTAATGREGRRSRSRFLDGLVPASVRSVRIVPSEPSPRVAAGDRSPLSNALRAWRTARARADSVAPFIVFHDSTIEAIADRRPRTIPELRRVPGVGPMKLDRYGEEIVAIVAGADQPTPDQGPN